MSSTDEGARRDSSYRIDAFFFGPFIIVLGTVIAAGLAVASYLYGGVPHDYDAYGVVALPGSAVLELPAGRVNLDHADDVANCWDNHSYEKNASIYNIPDGTEVRVTPADGGPALKVTSVPPWLGISESGCRGHEPWARIDVPAAGRYVVETTSAEAGPLGPPPAAGALPTGGARSSSGPGIAFGQPWSPFGSPLACAGLVLAAGVALAWTPWLVRKRIIRAGTHAATEQPR